MAMARPASSRVVKTCACSRSPTVRNLFLPTGAIHPVAPIQLGFEVRRP